MNAQSKTIKYQAEQIKHLQEITKNGMSLKKKTYHATRSNTKKIHTIPRNLVRSYMFQHNVNNDKPDAYSKQGLKKQKMPSLQFETNKASKKHHATIKREDISILPVTQPCLSRRGNWCLKDFSYLLPVYKISSGYFRNKKSGRRLLDLLSTKKLMCLVEILHTVIWNNKRI